MRWSIRLARFGETEVRIHLTFLLLLLWFGVTAYNRGGAAAAVQSLVFICALFGCVLLHEFGHVLAARAYGIPTPDITLLPIGGVARLQRMPEQPAQELVVALAGPAVNVVIALGLFLGLGGAARIYDPAQFQTPSAGVLSRLMSVNVWLVLFNLIPAFPMDGGRVLRAILAMRVDYARATRMAASAGQILAFVFGFLGLMGNPMLLFIALFVYLGAGQEAAMAEMKQAARGLTLADVMITDYRTLAVTATLNDAVEALIRTSQHDFPVAAEDGRIMGLLTRQQLIVALRERGPAAPVAEVMRPDIPTFPMHGGFERAYQWMGEADCPVVLVADWAGKVVGLLTAENVGEVMMVQAAMGERSTMGHGDVAGDARDPRRIATA